jgi:hypothetical protein
MEWSTIWDWLLVPENQKALAFLGTGFAAVVMAIWAVFKFFHKDGRVGKPPADVRPSSVNVTADHGSVAAGRDANVSKTEVRSK